MIEDVLAIFRADREKRNELLLRGYDVDQIDVSDYDAILAGTKQGPKQADDASGLSLRRLSSYETREVQWLRKPFFQGSAFHLLVGKKGVCKGTFLCGLAARTTTGRMYPEPRTVLVVTSEDSVELDFKPRFIAAQGDEERVFIVNGDFRLPRDTRRLKAVAEQLGDVGLVIVDPIGNHLQDSDTDREGSVRHAIAPLNGLADELGCMIFGVRHLAKDATRGALASVLGSTAWVDVPRCVIAMAQDDVDDAVFHAAVVAGNRGPRSSRGREFRLSIVDVPGAAGVTYLDGLGDSEKDINELLSQRRGPAVVDVAKLQAVLLAALEGRSMSVPELKAHAWDQLRASGDQVWGCLQALRGEGRAQTHKLGDVWLWSLRSAQDEAA